MRIVVWGDLQNKELFGDSCSPTASMRNLKYFLADAANHKARVHQLDIIWSLLQAKVKNRIFVKLERRYADYFSEYSNYFGRGLRLLKSIYGMTNSRKLSAGELIEWLPEAGFIRSKWQMSIHYKYTPYGTNIIVLYYVDDCVYWYTSESLGKRLWIL